MKQIIGQHRLLAFQTSLEAPIGPDNPVRVIDAFVETLSLEALGFSKVFPKATGRPAYQPRHLLKLYLYGYYNHIRSSRRLAAECVRNIELHWLLEGLTPAYHTIADFRKQHPLSLREVFLAFVAFLKEQSLLSGEYVAIDGAKFRAVNSKKNNYNQPKIDRHLAYIDHKTKEYLHQLDTCDQLEQQENNEQQEDHEQQETAVARQAICTALAALQERRQHYQLLTQAIKESDDGQVSTTDPESRALIQHRNIVEVSYNVQTAVESEHKLILYYQALNKNDSKALAPVALAAKQVLGRQTITVLADKGYHNGAQLAHCAAHNILTLVAYREQTNGNGSPVPTAEYQLEQFSYQQAEDVYLCPQGEVLSTNGNAYKKNLRTQRRRNALAYHVKHYKTAACRTCVARACCTTNKNGRLIERSEYTEAIQENNQRLRDNKQLYRQRQAIVEHPFGTIKRGWGYSYTLLKGLEKVNGEMGLIFTVYNLRRTVSILSVPLLVKLLQSKKRKPFAYLVSQIWAVGELVEQWILKRGQKLQLKHITLQAA
jgi:transposase